MRVEGTKLYKDLYLELHDAKKRPAISTMYPERMEFDSVVGRAQCIANILYVAGKFTVQESYHVVKAGYHALEFLVTEEDEQQSEALEAASYHFTAAKVRFATNCIYVLKLTAGVLVPSAAIGINKIKQLELYENELEDLLKQQRMQNFTEKAIQLRISELQYRISELRKSISRKLMNLKKIPIKVE